ncbi:hypothetical protein NECID01_2162, partial [Nematocida sp. AWRm77]
ILMLIGFAVVCASQVEVELPLKSSNTSIRVTVPEGAFQMIDNQAMLALLYAENSSSISEKTRAEKYTLAAECAFESETEYEQFRKLWDIDSPALSTEYSAPAQGPTDLTEDLSKELFEKCLVTANYLDIQGDYAKRFFKNMTKYGLFGKHSADIMSSKILSPYYLSHDTLWDLLYGFLDQIDFNHRTTHPSAGQTMLRIESTSIHFKEIDKEYTGPSQTAKIRTVLHTSLWPVSSPVKKRNEAVLVCLLSSLGGSSVDIQYNINTTSEDLSQTIQNLTKENEKERRVYVEGLKLYVDYENNTSLLPALQLVPDLSRVELDIDFTSDSNAERSSLVSVLSSCKALKVLKIDRKILESAEVHSLAESLPNFEQLSLWCQALEDRAIDSLKKCTKLKVLKIFNGIQSSASVQELVSHLPLLRELTIRCEPLEPAAAEAFQTCTKIEKLEIGGKDQPSASVQTIVTHLPLLKELNIGCKALAPAAAEAFQTCTRLEKLEMVYGELQPSSAVQAIVRRLPLLRELNIECESLDLAAAEAFQACAKIEILKINGETQPSTTVQAIVRRLPLLRELSIKCESLEPAAAEAFQTCTKIERLNVYGVPQPSAVVQALIRRLPSLKHLKIGIDSADLVFADTLRNCFNLRNLRLTVIQYTPGFMARYLQDPLPSLESLTLHNHDTNNNHSEEDNRAVEEAREKEIYIILSR